MALATDSASMARALWKGPFFQLSLLNAIKADANREGVKTHARSNTIIPSFIGARLLVHNGRDYIPLVVREEMVGKKIGDFVATQKPFSYRATNAGKKAAKK